MSHIPINSKYRFAKNDMGGWDIQKLGKLKGKDNWTSVKHGMSFRHAVKTAHDMLLTDENFTNMTEAEAAFDRCCQRLSIAVGAKITIEG